MWRGVVREWVKKVLRVGLNRKESRLFWVAEDY